MEWLKVELEVQEATDKLILEENDRRHIKLTRDYEDKFFNFTSNLNWSFIEYIYQKESKSNQNDFDNMNDEFLLDSNEDENELSLCKK